MKSDKQKLFVLLLITVYIIQDVEAVCSTQGCSICIYTLSGTSFKQSCNQCITGYILNSAGNCDFNVGLIAGLSAGAVTIIIIQIVGFCICQLYFKHKFRKPVQYTLQQIFTELKQWKQNPKAVQELNQKYKDFIIPQQDPNCPEKDCRYCSFYQLNYQDRKGWPQFYQYEKWLKEKEQRRKKKLQSNQDLNSQDEQQYEEVNPKGPTVKLDSCKHYYHLPCLKKQVRNPLHIDKQNKDPHQKNDDGPSCICKQDLSEMIVVLICRVCKTKERKLKFRLKQKGIQGLKEYTCAVCYNQTYKQLEKKKWINKLIQ